MRKPLLNKYYVWATVIMVAFIVYGSLFPFSFQAHEDASPLAVLLTTWHSWPTQLGNFIGNIFFYLPLGFLGVLSMGESIRGAIRFGVIVAVGVALCFSMELSQVYIPVRVTAFDDIYANVLGTSLGATAGLVLGADFLWGLRPVLRARPIPILLLGAFLAYRLYPYVPSVNLQSYWQALKPVVRHPHFDAYDIARYVVMWLVVAVLGQALIGVTCLRRFLVPGMLCVLGAKVAIRDNSVSVAEIVGVAVAFLAWLGISRTNTKMGVIMITLMLAGFVVAQRLQPFHFLTVGHAFGWVPFASFLHGSMGVNAQSALEKFFFYGALIWMLTRSGMALGVAGLSVSLGLLVTSGLETHLPGRSAEITDAVMALVITGIFALIGRLERERWM